MNTFPSEIERANSSESARAYSLAFSTKGYNAYPSVEKASERQRIDSRIFAFPRAIRGERANPFPLGKDSRFARSLGAIDGVLA